MKTMLDPDELRVESFPTAEADAAALEHGALVRTPLCSAIDACPTRIC